jgi:hypothetical protein
MNYITMIIFSIEMLISVPAFASCISSTVDIDKEITKKVIFICNNEYNRKVIYNKIFKAIHSTAVNSVGFCYSSCHEGENLDACAARFIKGESSHFIEYRKSTGEIGILCQDKSFQ